MEKKYIRALLLVSLAVFILIAIGEVTGSFLNMNQAIMNYIQSFENKTMTTIMIFISDISEWFVYIPIAFILILIPKTRFTYGLPSMCTLVATSGVNYILKDIFAEQRPHFHRLIAESGYGFPSAHAMVGTAFIGICTYIFLTSDNKISLKIFASLVSISTLLIVGLSRIYLGVHFPTDVLGGYMSGTFMGALSLIAFEYLANPFLMKYVKGIKQT